MKSGKVTVTLHDHVGTCRHLERQHWSSREIRFKTKEKGLFKGTEGRCTGCEHECGAVRVIGSRGRVGAWRIEPVNEPVD